MKFTKSRRGKAQAFLALSCVGSVFTPAAMAQTTGSEAQQERALGGVTVTDTAIEENNGRRQETPRATRPVRDTPQTITILTKEVLEQQNLLTLRDMLSTVPGITFGAAEGGSPPADSINFRGYSASNDITQDGVRDSAAYSRSDSFNLEQLEVTNGANSVMTGAGSVGGSINIVTKRPLADTAIKIGGGVGTSEYYRGTLDANFRVSDLIAVRLNAVGHKNGIPGRDVEKNERWGIAPSITIGVDGPTKLSLLYLHQKDDNIPQYGVPYYKNAFNDGALPGSDRGAYYGYRNVDRQDITVDQATIIGEHQFSDTVSIRNLGRWQSVKQLTVVGPPQGTYCLASGRTPTGALCTVSVGTAPNAVTYTVPAGYYYIGGPRGNYRDSKNELLFDQVDLKADFATGPIEHTLVVGASVTWEKYTLLTGNALRNADGTAVYARYPLMNIANPYDVIAGPAIPAAFTSYGSNLYTGPVNLIATGRTLGESTNYALYAFDAMKIGKFEINGGIRWESVSSTSKSGLTTQTLTGNDAKFASYRVGLVYKPIEAVSLYVAYGNSKTPSQSNVNGSCTTTVGTGTCSVRPEGAKNYEIGAKAELFEGGLLLTAAAFRNERDSYRVDSGEVGQPAPQLDGNSRVDGISLGAVGKISPAWSLTANYTYLDGKLIQSVSNYCLNNPAQGTCTNTVANPDPLAGVSLANTPKHSGSLFTTYTLPFGLTLGYGATYQGKFAFSAAATGVIYSDPYWVHNAYVNYNLTPTLSAQVNVKNIGDKLYYTRIRNNGWATPGDGRAAVLTINYKL
jgi:catecholate siderophore receptor